MIPTMKKLYALDTTDFGTIFVTKSELADARARIMGEYGPDFQVDGDGSPLEWHEEEVNNTIVGSARRTKIPEPPTPPKILFEIKAALERHGRLPPYPAESVSLSAVLGRWQKDGYPMI